MLKRFISIIAAAAVMFSLYVPVTGSFSHGAVTVRTSLPSYSSVTGRKYYYSDNNIFYKYNYGPPKMNGGMYVTGNCTWYVYGRASELLGQPLNTNFRWDAAAWWNVNKRGNYFPYGRTPKVGAIACYDTHVAIVEKVVNGRPYVSESGWRRSSWKPTSASQISFNYGTPWKGTSALKGYIYILDGKSQTTTKTVNYKVNVTAKDLNMRTGPSGTYSRVGYVDPGKYTVVKECGDWGKLKETGYWVYLDYVTKIASKADNVVDKGTSVNLKIKVKAEDLNMRTGPATSYKCKGYITPGTYTVEKKYGDWGKVSETGFWINLKYVTVISGSTSSKTVSYSVKVTTDGLNMRTGPAVEYTSKGKLKKGSVYDIKAENSGWGQLKTNGYWINLSCTEKVDSSYTVKVTVKDLNMRTGPSSSYKSKGYLKPGTYTIKATKNGWGQLKTNGYWINLKYVNKSTENKKADSSYKVRVKAKDLNMRTGPSSSYKSKGYLKPGTYTIKATKNGWGQLKTNGYWINLKYVNKSTEIKMAGSSYKVRVKVKDLNMRTGPGTSYKAKGYLKRGTYTIKATKNGWGQLKTNGYWIKLSYVSRI
ncbi:MAG: CHAP domain-containing protein [Clostridiales bacterium]|nr:CHAP domain-containing protein [Clostridiales bacterium]